MATKLKIDRSGLADTAQPDRLAVLLIDQLKPQLDRLLPVPIRALAEACGILEIRSLDTGGFEGGLIQDEFKKHGYILAKSGRHERRTRFTVAHELGHFVNLRHVAPRGAAQFLCTKEYLRTFGAVTDKRLGVEAQANEFAANILMPQTAVGAMDFMRGSPEIARILALHDLCEVSKEAASRRYAELHGGDFAVVFSKEGKLIYPVRGGDFPALELRPGQQLFRDTLTRTFVGEEGETSAQEESDPSWWLADRDSPAWELWEEVLLQQDGYRMTLLLGERVNEVDDRLAERWAPPKFR